MDSRYSPERNARSDETYLCDVCSKEMQRKSDGTFFDRDRVLQNRAYWRYMYTKPRPLDKEDTLSAFLFTILRDLSGFTVCNKCCALLREENVSHSGSDASSAAIITAAEVWQEIHGKWPTTIKVGGKESVIAPSGTKAGVRQKRICSSASEVVKTIVSCFLVGALGGVLLLVGFVTFGENLGTASYCFFFGVGGILLLISFLGLLAFLRGCFVGEIWELTCPLCKHVYRIGKDATIATLEEGVKLAAAAIIIGDGSAEELRTDLVGSLDGCAPGRLAEARKDARKIAKMVQKAIAKGQRRLWMCADCKNDYQPFEYPSLSPPASEAPDKAILQAWQFESFWLTVLEEPSKTRMVRVLISDMTHLWYSFMHIFHRSRVQHHVGVFLENIRGSCARCGQSITREEMINIAWVKYHASVNAPKHYAVQAAGYQGREAERLKRLVEGSCSNCSSTLCSIKWWPCIKLAVASEPKNLAKELGRAQKHSRKLSSQMRQFLL